MKIKLITFIFLFLLFPLNSYSGTYYICDDASGTWGTSAGQCGHPTDGPLNPCNINQAVANVAPGDTVRLQDDGGAYDDDYAGLIGGWDANQDPTMASGTSGNWITWEPAPGDTPIIGNPRTATINLKGLSYHRFKNLTIYAVSNRYINMLNDFSNNGTHHIIFDGCDIYAKDEWTWTIVGAGGKTNNIVFHNNTFRGYNLEDQTFLNFLYFLGASGETIEKILVDGDTMYEAAGHVMLEFQTNYGTIKNIIIRNSSFENQIHTGINIYGTSTVPQYVLIENNNVFNSGIACSLDGDCSEMICWTGTDYLQAREVKGGLQFYGADSIIRHNRFYKSGKGISFNGPTNLFTHVAVYNNVFYKNCRGFIVDDWGFDVDQIALMNNIFRNNTELTYEATNYPIRIDLHNSDNYLFDIYGNLEDETIDSRYYTPIANETQTIIEMDADPDTSDVWHDNVAGSALFQNESVYNFNLTSSSSAINAGKSLTLTSGAGSGTSLIVDSATPFQDGSLCPDSEMTGLLGLTCEGDWIAIGTVDNIVQISAINYTTNTITLASSKTWADDANVWLYKDSDGTILLKGSAPDIGAYEYDYSLDSLTGVTLSGVSLQ